MGARGCGKEGEGNGAGLGGDRWWGQVWGEGRRGGGGMLVYTLPASR